MDAGLTGRNIINVILGQMDENQFPLLYCVLVPGLFQIMLREEDYEDLEGFFPKIKEEASRALDEKLQKLNTPGRLAKIRRRKPLKFENPMDDWYIEFLADTDREVPLGEPFAVKSQIALWDEPEYGVGAKTISLKTVRLKGGSQNISRGEGKLYGKLFYRDAKGGAHTHHMTKTKIVVGRGGKEHWVDWKLDTVDDVSRNHFRLRYDEQRGQFFIKDISQFGTTVDGRRIRSALTTIDGVTREIDVEEALPTKAKIGLADKVFIDFSGGGDQ